MIIRNDTKISVAVQSDAPCAGRCSSSNTLSRQCLDMSGPVQKAADNLLRDIRKAIVPVPERTDEGCRIETKKRAANRKAAEQNADVGDNQEPESKILLVHGDEAEECFTLDAAEDALLLSASDELGFIYGLYEISRRFLGILPFWFWNDQVIVPKEAVEIPAGFHYTSQPYAIRFRGWFINDEVLLADWQACPSMEACSAKDGSAEQDSDRPWEMALEALLRLGGNLVIPGTDRNSVKYRPLASSMGLYVTHHHAEPLGAPIFAREYPDLQASYAKYPEKFQELWRRGIEEQKDRKTVWNLGFRGQGDAPFWEADPAYQTDEARGQLISDLIRLQYEMVQEAQPGAVCCTNLYGETMELYQKGCLKLPEQIIKVWADNGYGKMVSRRQGNHNPRVPALPEAHNSDIEAVPEGYNSDLEAFSTDCHSHLPVQSESPECGPGGHHGIYYHVSFYDLQAGNHITMLPNSPDFVVRELDEVLQHGVHDFWLINCSNIKPHVYMLDLVAQIWKRPLPSVGGRTHCPFQDASRGAVLWKRPLPSINSERQSLAESTFVETHRKQYLRDYFGPEHLDALSACLQQYFDAAVSYGPHEDDHAGEQFYNHGIRILVSQYLKDSKAPADDFRWAKEAESLTEQISWYRERCGEAAKSYGELLCTCEKTAAELNGSEKTLFEDSIYLQAKIYAYCAKGGCQVCRGLEASYKGEYQKAFYLVGKGRKEYLRARQDMRAREHGVWKNFYRNECLTDIAQTAWVLETVMGYIRNFGDGPHFCEWQREFLYAKEDQNVRMILNLENHLNNQELFELMEEKMETHCSWLP